MSNITILGENGRLGLALSKALKKCGYIVRGTSSNPKAAVQFKLDLRAPNFTEFSEFIKKSDIVINCIGVNPKLYRSYDEIMLHQINVINLMETLNIVLKNKSKIIHVSGAIVYQDPFQRNITENSPIGENSWSGIYGKHKYIIDKYINNEPNVLVIRPSSIFGFRMINEGLIDKIYLHSEHLNHIEIKENVNDSFGLIDTNTIADFIIFAIASNLSGIFNLSLVPSFTILQIATQLSEVINKSIKIIESNTYSKERYLYDLSIKKAENIGFKFPINRNSPLLNYYKSIVKL